MRHSASLQELSTSPKVDLEQGSFDLEFNKSYIRNKPLRVLQRDGIASSFSKDRSSSTAPSSWKKWIRTSLICLTVLLLLFFLIYISSRYFNNSLTQKASDYLVILDCGSTGSRVFVYKWSAVQRKSDKGLPFVLSSLPQEKSASQTGRAYERMGTEPGFSKLLHNETGLEAAIKPLLQWAEKQVPKDAHKSTSLFVYATAGVRRLPNSDSEWLMEKAWSILKKSSFSCQRNWVKTITGMEEAYYGWIALNYHMGMLGPSPAQETYGALDLGGSSLQVTFENEEPVNDETGINLSIGEVSHYLSAYSLAGYGLNDAFDKSVVHLLKLQGEATTKLNNGKIELKHPCLQSGYKEDYTCLQCGTVNRDGSPVSGGKTLEKGRTGIPVELIGAPQWEECSALAKVTVNLSEWSNLSSGLDCDARPCALADNLPLPHGQFYATSGFFVVYRFFNLSPNSSLDDLLQMGHEFCGKTWEVAKNSVPPQPFIEQYCFRAPYIASLLRKGLHIKENEVLIGSGSITWTLGVALLEAGQTFSRKNDFHGYNILHTHIKPVFLVLMFLLSLFLLLCAISYASDWISTIFRRSYLPLFNNNSASPSVLNLQRWSPTGDGRVKMPLSPTVPDSQQHPFDIGGSNIQLMEPPFHPSGFGHSFSSGNLGQLQFGNRTGSSFMTPLRGQTLQSRRSQSRDDLISSVAES